MAAINTAVEATTLNERTFRFRSQDKLIQEYIEQEDILVVSIGGNDVALCPCPFGLTVWASSRQMVMSIPQ